ncbi:MAG TPA: HAMP domain-containing sensor histidine kinase [Planctomycetota bacterium]|nr:HAMP domain-containing sensor histidine kinase [Planctomycetota bacterium]
MLDEDGLVVEINAAMLAGSALARGDVIGQPLVDAPLVFLGRAARARLRRALEGRFAGAVRLVDPSSGITIDVATIRAGRSTLRIVEARDAGDGSSALDAATRALAKIGESAAILAHELKTPITALHLALRAVARRLTADERELVEELAARLARVERRCRDALAMARPRRLELRRFSARSLLRGALVDVEPRRARRGVTIDLDVHPECLELTADFAQLSGAVVNLLLNAVEAARPSGRVAVSASAEPGGGACIAVDDDGPGVPSALRAKLFRPFVSSKDDGNGLGLVVCDRVAAEHGGAIGIETSALGGARFWIRLPPP